MRRRFVIGFLRGWTPQATIMDSTGEHIKWKSRSPRPLCGADVPRDQPGSVEEAYMFVQEPG